MKIAFIPSTFLPNIGGAEIQTHNIANKLVEEGHEVDVFLLDKINIQNAKYKIIILNKYLISFVFLLKYYFNVNLSFLLKFYFKRIIKKNNISIWHFQSVNYKTLIYLEELKKLKQKIVVTLQGADIQIDYEIKYGYRLDKKYDLYLKKVFQNVDLFNAISQSIKNELLNLGVREEKIILIPNCSPIEKFESFPRKKNRDLTLLTIGRYAVKKKGFDLVKNVAKELSKITKFKWIIIGRNTPELLKDEYIKKNIDNFEIIDEIKNYSEDYFPNSNLIKYYKQSDVYLNLARVEGSPIVLIDAIAGCLPIISFNTRGGDELVIDELNGFIIDNFDFKFYAEKVLSFKNFEINPNNPKIREHVFKFGLTENTKKIIECYKYLSDKN